MLLTEVNGFALPEKSIALQTSKRRDIENGQVFEISDFEINQHKDYGKPKYQPVKFRTSPSPIYNCHGLTFASRRTWISKEVELRKILEDDNYQNIVDITLVLPGDIILYINNDDKDICHSGVVLEARFIPNSLPDIKILSKWGKYGEAIHSYITPAYPNTSKTFYRMSL